MVEINSDNVIIDHTWLWRADHDVGGSVYNYRDYVKSSLVVNGNNVKAYGLFGQHPLGTIVEWNGDNGETYFFQSEIAYDATSDYANKGYTGYKVGNNVYHHKGYGLGVYTFFRDHSVYLNSAISCPSRSGIKFVNALAVHLTGHGGINHVVNSQGGGVRSGVQTSYLCNYNSVADTEEQ